MRNLVGYVATVSGALALSVISSSAQIFSPLHTFSAASGFQAPLTQGPDGTLYGTSSAGGLGGGTVFRINPDGTHFAILHAFGPGSPYGSGYINPDGYAPVAGLVLSNNVLYGTTKLGGATAYGSVFKINTDGSGFATLRFFTNGVDGGTLSGGLVLADGALYGTTESGVGNVHGTVFKINTDGTGFATLRTFGFDTNGAAPMASMILSGGTLYGTCRSGNFINGTVFMIDTNGLNFAVLHRFTTTFAGTNIDGAAPEASLVLSGNMLYGTASGGGRGYGTIFAVNTDGAGFTNLYSFTNGLDGGTPVAALTLSGSTLYGTTTKGGPDGILGTGTIFKINTDGSDFTSITNFATLRGGGMPGGGAGGLILSSDTLLGAGGAVVFSINTNGTNPSVLAKGNDGQQPLGGLVLSGNTLYGTTSAGGFDGSGTIFQVNANGAGFSLLHSFSATSGVTNTDGATPVGTLIVASGKLFGVAKNGGAFNAGAIFSIATNGTGFTNLHSFTNVTDGSLPWSGLALGGSTLFGTTHNGGISNSGTIFKINTDGSDYQTIFSFSNSAAPESRLVLSGDTLYGTTLSGGTNGNGMVFKIRTNGTGFAELFSFKAPTNLNDTINVSGAGPVGDLILSGNTLYGTTASGGSFDDKGAEPGTVFRINTDGTGFMRLHLFGGIGGNFGGIIPMAGLALSGNTLYGTTSTGGNGSAGTVFQLDTDGNNFATIHTFAFQGGTPMGDLIVMNGLIYGTTEFSDQGSGYVFSVTPTAAPMVQFTASPTNGIPPQAVQFSAPGVDDNGNTILGWYWNFDDGTPTYTITITTNHGGIFTNYNYISTQNPLHTYTNNGTYAPSLIATNNNGTTVLGFGPAVVIAYPSSILNNGFETGTFTNWTRTGIGGSSISTATQYKHSGTYGAELLASGGPGYLSQTITTTPGALYLVSFWLDVPFNFTPNEFSVTWGGNVLMDETNIPHLGWTNIQFLVTATSTSTVLQFGYRDGYFGLDDVSVASIQPVISGFTFSGSNLVLTNTGGLSNRTYLVLTSTNAAQPLMEWMPIATNVLGSSGGFSITATNAVIPNAAQQFYILRAQ